MKPETKEITLPNMEGWSWYNFTKYYYGEQRLSNTVWLLREHMQERYKSAAYSRNAPANLSGMVVDLPRRLGDYRLRTRPVNKYGLSKFEITLTIAWLIFMVIGVFTVLVPYMQAMDK